MTGWGGRFGELTAASAGQVRILIVAGLVAANLFLLGLSALSLQASREQHELRAHALTQGVAQAVENRVSISIERIDLALRAVADEFERQLATGGIDERAVASLLARYEQRLPEVEAIRVADARGRVVFGRGLGASEEASWADREYFTHLREHPEAGLQVSSPRLGRVARIHIVGFARRYNHPDGSFAGVVSAPVAVDTFTSLLSEFDVGMTGTIVLRDAGLGLIARYPAIVGHAAGVVGHDGVSAELRELARSGQHAATYHTARAADGAERILSFRRLEAAPMLVSMGVAREEYLAGWYVDLRRAALGVIGFVVFSLAVGGVALQLLGRVVRESARNRIYLHHASDGVHILDPHGRLIEASDRFCAMLGYTRAEMMGMNAATWLVRPAGDPYDLAEAGTGAHAASAFESVYRCKDGSLIDVDVHVVAIELGGVRHAYASAREIGERKRQQLALQQSEARLRESEARYRLLLGNSPVGILHYGHDLVVTYANERFEQIMQVPPGHMVGLDCTRLQDQSVVPPLRRALAGEAAHYEGQYVTTYGARDLWISMDCAPVRDGAGEIVGGIAILEDITERISIQESERRQRESLVRLNEIAAFSHQPLAQQQVQALAIGARHLGLQYGIISHVVDDAYRIVAHVAPPDTLHDGQEFSLERTYCEITLRQQQVVAIAKMGSSPHAGHPCYRDFRLEAYIGAPIYVDGKVFGTANFSSPQPRRQPFDAGDREFVRLLANWVGSAIERDQARERLRLAASVFTDAHEGILICDAERVVVDVNPTFSEITGFAREEIIGKTPRVLSSGRHDGDFYAAMWQDVARHGHWEGELWNHRRDGTDYAQRLTISCVRDESGRVTHYIGNFSDVTQLKAQQGRLEHLAHYDALTDLPNRALLADRMRQALAQARRAGTQVAVCYLDLDGFKAVNDELGHDAGDALLVEVARRLRETVRAGDSVARLGGDEFVLLLAVAGVEDCDRAATRVLRALTEPIPVGGEAVRCISGSLGIALFPDDDGDPDALLRYADQAMYQAKQAGKNRYQLFDAAQDHRARERRQLHDRLRQALADGEFRLYYQPIVDMRSGAVQAFEGLVRWVHPERGVIQAADFLPLLEHTEFDPALGRWVLAEGLRQLATWRRMGFAQRLALNVSTMHLLAPDFVETLTALLAAHPEVEAHALQLEIRETATLGDVDAALAVLHGCRRAGVDIALDDFGSDHASLAYFRRLPIDTLKLDRNLISALPGSSEDLAVIDSVVGLTRAFERSLVAEGVESEEVGLLLVSKGCSVGQGYAIAPPMPAEEVPAWLAAAQGARCWAAQGVGEEAAQHP